MSDLSHTIVVKPNLFLRLFVWFWDCAGVRLNTCLIFWGTVGMIVGWPFRLLGALVAPVTIPLFERLDNKLERSRQDSRPVSVETVKPKEPSRGTRLLTKLAHAGSFIWYKFQTPITWTLRILVGLAILALAGFAVYGASTIAWSWTILWVALIWVGIIVGAVALIMIGAALYDRHQRKNRVKRHNFRRIMRSVHDHTCANVIIENTNVGSSTIQEA